MKARPQNVDTPKIPRTSSARGFDSQGDALPESEISANDLPPNWRWVRVREIGEVQLGRQRAPKRQNGKHMRPDLRVANVFEDRLDLSDVLTMNFTPREFESFSLRANDILAVLKLADSVDRFYIQNSLNSPFCYAPAQKFTHGVGNQHLGLTRMIHIRMALPPLAEQRRIVAEVERRLSVVVELEAVVFANLQRATRLRQSILQKAFTGELV